MAAALTGIQASTILKARHSISKPNRRLILTAEIRSWLMSLLSISSSSTTKPSTCSSISNRGVNLSPISVHRLVRRLILDHPLEVVVAVVEAL